MSGGFFEQLAILAIPEPPIFCVDNTMIDALLKQMPRFRPPVFWDDLGLLPGQYFAVTLHGRRM